MLTPAATERRGTALVVEDEQSIASLVSAYLQRDGFEVVWTTTKAGCLLELEHREPQVVILDIGLPDGDGFEVCRLIRERSTVPVVMLTARDEEHDRIAGLDLGADDYISKPFSPRELLARIRAVLRRSDGAPPAKVLEIADVVVRRDAREVTVGDDVVELRAKEFDLLAFLIENADRVVTRDVLLARVWGLDYPGGTRTVDVHVAQLRSKLGRPDLIRTLRGVGYKAVTP